MSDEDRFRRPGHRMTVALGTWHGVEAPLSVMVLAVPRGRLPAYILISYGDGVLPERSRTDWETLVNWELAEFTKPPASVTPLHLPKDAP